MLLKIKSGNGSVNHSFPVGTTMKEFRDKITELTGLAAHEMDVLYGYPIQPVKFSNPIATLESQGIESGCSVTVRPNVQRKEIFEYLISLGFNEENVLKVLLECEVMDKTIALELCKEISCVENENITGTIIRMRIPPDNSCLFNAIGYLLEGSFNPVPYRVLVADAIRKDPTTFTAEYLDMDPAKYINWIQNPEKWGG